MKRVNIEALSKGEEEAVKVFCDNVCENGWCLVEFSDEEFNTFSELSDSLLEFFANELF